MMPLLQLLKKTYKNNKKSSRIFKVQKQQIHNCSALKNDSYKLCKTPLTKYYNQTNIYRKKLDNFITL